MGPGGLINRVPVQARSLHKVFAFTSVVWLVCYRSSGVTGQLRSLSGHNSCLCVGKFTLGISSLATKVIMLILCFSSKGQEKASPGLQPGPVALPNLLITQIRQSSFHPVLCSL